MRDAGPSAGYRRGVLARKVVKLSKTFRESLMHALVTLYFCEKLRLFVSFIAGMFPLLFIDTSKDTSTEEQSEDNNNS